MAENNSKMDFIIKITTFNCNSIRNKVDIIRDILSYSDLLLCQEIVLLEDECDFLNQIDDEFNVIGNPSKCAQSLNFEGRPSGGFAVIWLKSLGFKINV